MKKLNIYLLMIACCMASFCMAQWTADPMQNTFLSDDSGSQALPKIAICTDGYSYISWFSLEDGNYNVRMQRLDKDGNIMWAPNGILVSDHEQMSWLTDYALSVDLDNYALLTFQDIRNVDNNPVGYRISPQGEMMWGADGVNLSTSSNFEANPQVCATEEGNVVFAWPSQGDANEVHMQKVSASGDLLWGDGIVLSSSSESFTFPFLQSTEGDHVFLIWHKESGPFWSPNRGMYVQKIDTDGSFMWENDLEIYAPAPGGAVITLDMCSDKNGGIIFTWYGNDVGTHFNGWVQHMDNSGMVTMEANGAVISTSQARNHMYPTVSFLEETQEVLVFFSEQDLNQNQRGLYAQKFDLMGNRQWTDEGKELIALSNNDYSLPMARGLNDRAICVYQAYEFGNVTDSKMQAVCLNSDGDNLWEPAFVDLSTAQSSKMHTDLSSYFWGQWVCVWEDERNGNSDIYAQNIQPDGTLGLVVTQISEQNPRSNPMIYPNPCSDNLTINIAELSDEKAAITLYDEMGRIHLSVIKPEGNKEICINTKGLDKGFYFYKITNGTKVYSGKLIKE